MNVPSVRIFSTLAVQGALQDPVTGFAFLPTIVVAAEYAPTSILMARIRKDDRPDLAVLTAEGAAELVAERLCSTPPIPVAVSTVGVAAARGAQVPTLSSTQDLFRFLRTAPSIAYSRTGASGIFFAALLDRLGLRAEVDAKSVIVPSGLVAERVASGEVAFAIQQMSELKLVSGIGPLVRLPDEAQSITTFSIVRFAAGPGTPAAAIVDHLLSRAFLDSLAAWGLDAPHPTS